MNVHLPGEFWCCWCQRILDERHIGGYSLSGKPHCQTCKEEMESRKSLSEREKLSLERKRLRHGRAARKRYVTNKLPDWMYS